MPCNKRGGITISENLFPLAQNIFFKYFVSLTSYDQNNSSLMKMIPIDIWSQKIERGMKWLLVKPVTGNSSNLEPEQPMVVSPVYCMSVCPNCL